MIFIGIIFRFLAGKRGSILFPCGSINILFNIVVAGSEFLQRRQTTGNNAHLFRKRRIGCVLLLVVLHGGKAFLGFFTNVLRIPDVFLIRFAPASRCVYRLILFIDLFFLFTEPGIHFAHFFNNVRFGLLPLARLTYRRFGILRFQQSIGAG